MKLSEAWTEALSKIRNIPHKHRYQYCMNVVRKYYCEKRGITNDVV